MDQELLEQIKMNRAREERKENIADIVDQLTRALNVMGREEEVAEDFLEAIQKKHRTLQQCTMGLMFKTIHGYQNAPHDLRNEGAVNACKRISELLEGEEIHLPLI